MYHLERGDSSGVLALYDRSFRNLASPLTQAQPDLYIDMQNAASMLFRLERQGWMSATAGSRWRTRPRRGSAIACSAFTLPHWMMALAATRPVGGGARMLGGDADFAQGPGHRWRPGRASTRCR